jgi:hypothetical protein
VIERLWLEMAEDPVGIDLHYIVEGLNHPEAGERYQKAKAAAAEAKAAEASILGARAAERNAKYMFASVMVAAFSALVALASAIASAVSAYYSYLECSASEVVNFEAKQMGTHRWHLMTCKSGGIIGDKAAKNGGTD